MRIGKTMVIDTDSMNWGVFALTFGLVTVSEYTGQFVTSLLTLVTCIVTAHFLKRFLNHRWPQQQQKARRRAESKELKSELKTKT